MTANSGPAAHCGPGPEPTREGGPWGRSGEVVTLFDVLQEAVDRAGPGKLLFGSDGPWLHPGLELAKVAALGLNAADQALILGGNLITLMSQRRKRVAEVTPPAAARAGAIAEFRDPWFSLDER